MMGQHLFISYARADGKNFAHNLYDQLHTRGFTAWMDKRGGIEASERWDAKIEDAIETCSALVFVMTPGSVASENCRDEWSYAMAHDKLVIPLMVLPCKVPMRLHARQYIDFTVQNYHTAFAELIARLEEITGDQAAVADDDRVYIFISYKHDKEDEAILEELKRYMEYDVQEAGGIFWYDRGIDWGTNWDSEIKGQIEKADIALLFISQLYLNSPYITQQEIPAFLRKRREEGMKILPLILSECRWQVRDWLSGTQSLPVGREFSTVEGYRAAGKHKALYLEITNKLIEQVEQVQAQKREKRTSEAAVSRPKVSETMRQLSVMVRQLNEMNSPILPQWVVIAGGETIIGDGSLPDSPERSVKVAPFLMSKTAVTQQQYQRFVQAMGYRTPYEPEFFPDYSWDNRQPPAGKVDHPVVLVNATDAEAYCEWLTAELRLYRHLPDGWRVMLPTEEMWEMAARGNDHRPYPWGYAGPSEAVCNVNGTGTTPAGKFEMGASPYGVLDMVGNVWEWTATVEDGLRILRGGSWEAHVSPQTWRCAYRYREQGDHVYDTIGFRVAIGQSN